MHLPSIARLLTGFAVALALTASASAQQPAAKPGATAGAFRTISWDALVPPGWDPMKDFKGVDMSALSDADPRAQQMMNKVREIWDNAPHNPALAGQAVRIPGFVVPLEETKDGLKEFLLVPYFGACIHTPPPPANQIVHVLARTPVKGVRSMDAVWISGKVDVQRTDTAMGTSGYRIEAVAVEPYIEKPR